MVPKGYLPIRFEIRFSNRNTATTYDDIRGFCASQTVTFRFLCYGSKNAESSITTGFVTMLRLRR